MATMESVIKGCKPTITMIMVFQQVIYSGMNILWKLAANDGMDVRVLVAYRFIVGAAFMVPLAFYLERNTRPKLTWKVILFAFLCGLFGGALGQNLFFESLVLTSVTYSSAILILVPAFTFLIAVCFRLESLGWLKVLGTLVGIGGAMLFTFYKGPNITIWETNINLLNITTYHHQTQGGNSNNLLGVILAFLSCVSYSLWFIFQAKAAQHYPCPLSFTALMVLMASILSFIITVFMQRDWNQWKLGWNIRLLTVAYSATFGTAVTFNLITLAVAIRGPVFTAAFNPLSLIIVAIIGSLVLEEDLHLGSLLGGILIICGFYIILWGKRKENGTKKIHHTMAEDNAKLEDQESETIDIEEENSQGSIKIKF